VEKSLVEQALKLKLLPNNVRERASIECEELSLGVSVNAEPQANTTVFHWTAG